MEQKTLAPAPRHPFPGPPADIRSSPGQLELTLKGYIRSGMELELSPLREAMFYIVP